MAAINPMASGTFFITNCDKVEDGQLARASVVAAQGYKLFRWGGETFNRINDYVDHFDEIAKTNSVSGKFARGLAWMGNNVNPLITACVGVKILTSDDKEEALCKDGTGLMGMFLAEGQFKKLAKTHMGQSALANIRNAGGRYGKMLALVAEGSLFAATSIAGYGAASKIGGACLEAERAGRKESAEAETLADKTELEYLA